MKRLVPAILLLTAAACGGSGDDGCVEVAVDPSLTMLDPYEPTCRDAVAGPTGSPCEGTSRQERQWLGGGSWQLRFSSAEALGGWPVRVDVGPDGCARVTHEHGDLVGGEPQPADMAEVTLSTLPSSNEELATVGGELTAYFPNDKFFHARF